MARKEKISNAMLIKAIVEAKDGLIDADLGGNVIKKRIARLNQGKSGGYRAIILFEIGDKSFFVHIFPKNSQENIDKGELEIFKKLAKIFKIFGESEIAKLLLSGEFIEVLENDKK